MAVIPQPSLLSWHHIDAASEMMRLEMVMETIPDEELMRGLEADRNGRGDTYLVRAMWNSLLVAVVFNHESVQSLQRSNRTSVS